MSQPTLTAPCSSVSPLRQRMLDDMRLRGLRQETQRDYIRCVRSFAAFLERSPDSATPEDIRRFQVHQAETGVQPPTVNGSVSALRFLFTVTLDRPDLSRRFVLVRQPRKLPDVLSVAEVGRLLEATPGLKYKAALGTAYGAGLRVSEVAALKVDDIDSTRMLIRVEQGKGRKDRNAMLSPQLLGLLRLWWRDGRRRGAVLARGRPRGRGAPGGVAVPGPAPRGADLDPPDQPRRARGRRRRRPAQAGDAPYPALQLRHPPARTGRRHPRHPGAARTRQARHHRALRPGRDQDDPRRHRAAGAPRAADGRTEHNRLTRRATRAGGRRRLPRCRAGLPGGPGRAPEPAPAQGDGGHRAVPHRLPRWSCRGLRRLRPHAHRLQLLPQPALPQMPRGGRSRVAGRA